MLVYYQSCSNDHLYKTTNAESAQANSHPIVPVKDDNLSKATSNHLFSLLNEKMLYKATTKKLYPA